MKVLQICAAYKPAYIYGGPTMSVSMLNEQLAGEKIITEVFATTANGKTELPVTPGQKIQVDGVTVTYFKRLTKDHSHFSPALLRALWKRVKDFDVVHIHAWWNLVSIFSCMIAQMRNVPVIVSPRGMLSEYSHRNKNTGIKSLIHHFLSKPLLKKSTMHVTTEWEKKQIEKVIKPNPVIINLPNFVKLPTVASSIKSAQTDHLKLIFLSRIEEKKGLDLLIAALPLLKFSYSLTIVGDGEASYVNELKELANNNGSIDHINWMGFQGDNKFDLLAGHDLLVLPSYDENFGNVVIESLSQGTPVLISKTTGLAGYVTYNQLGWICDPEVASVSDQLEKINNNRNELLRVREAAPSQIKEDFDDNKLVQRYIEMYKSVAAN